MFLYNTSALKMMFLSAKQLRVTVGPLIYIDIVLV